MAGSDSIVLEADGIDLAATLAPLRCGASDPSFLLSDAGVWWATRTSEGPATVRFARSGPRVEARAWGPGRDVVLARAGATVGLLDRAEAFRPEHPALDDLRRRFRGLRLGHPGTVFETLVRAVVEQRVTSAQAKRSYRRLVATHGEPAPGPVSLLVPPAPERLATLPYYEFHPLGIERRRADTIRRAAALAPRLEEAATLDRAAARRRLSAVAGIGRWTLGHVMRTALGDPDAVIVGDFHMPNLVAWFLASEPRATDGRMLQLLEPWRGQRGRVMLLIARSGVRPPKFAPRRRVLEVERL